jgi:hypothetical protein
MKQLFFVELHTMRFAVLCCTSNTLSLSRLLHLQQVIYSVTDILYYPLRRTTRTVVPGQAVDTVCTAAP